jgi:hypothetical protein
MYVRFTIEKRDENSGRGLGIFHAAAKLRSRGEVAECERSLLFQIRDWFDNHLEKPDRFTASKPPYYRKQNKAISWFKDSATEHIYHARQMAAILQRHGITVRELRVERVGYVVYEDDFQIVAEAFRDMDC